jgi:hypothetical protein
MDRDEMSNLYRGPPIDAPYKDSVHLAKRFQRRRFFLERYSDSFNETVDVDEQIEGNLCPL